MTKSKNHVPLSRALWCPSQTGACTITHLPGKICQKTFETFETYTISNVVFSSGCTVIRGTCFRIFKYKTKQCNGIIELWNEMQQDLNQRAQPRWLTTCFEIFGPRTPVGQGPIGSLLK